MSKEESATRPQTGPRSARLAPSKANPTAPMPRHAASLERQIAAVERELAKVDRAVKNAQRRGEVEAIPPLTRQRRVFDAHRDRLRVLLSRSG
jgi:hypothetical protein